MTCGCGRASADAERHRHPRETAKTAVRRREIHDRAHGQATDGTEQHAGGGAPWLHPAIGDAHVADAHHQSEPARADQHHWLEGVRQRTAEHVEHVGAEREAEHQVFGAGRQAEAANRAAADQVAAEVRQQQEPEQQPDAVAHALSLPSVMPALDSASSAAI
jgi:hypothetical protein